MLDNPPRGQRLEFVISNLRLAELVAIVNANKDFYQDFVLFLKDLGYKRPYDFIVEPSDERALDVIERFLRRTSTAQLLDGIGRPYPNATARWYFLAWLLRDAPAQRLRPLLDQATGSTPESRVAYLLNQIRKFVGPPVSKPRKLDMARNLRGNARQAGGQSART